MAKDIMDYQYRLLTSEEAALESRLRLAFCGISGGGKTFSGLRTAHGIAQEVAKRLGKSKEDIKVVVVDSENKTSAKYKREFEARGFKYNIIPIGEKDVRTGKRDFSPLAYIGAILFAEKNGFDICLIDSLSHAWFGENGELDQVNAKAAASKSKNSYYAWRDVTPLHNRLVDTILQSSMHIIVTMRSKSSYIEDKEKGGFKKVGMEPIMRDGLDYEMDVCVDFDVEHTGVIGKTRYSIVDGEVYRPIDESFGYLLSEQVAGVPDPRFAELPQDRIEYARSLAKELGSDIEKSVEETLTTRRIPGSQNFLTPETLDSDLIKRLETKAFALRKQKETTKKSNSEDVSVNEDNINAMEAKLS